MCVCVSKHTLKQTLRLIRFFILTRRSLGLRPYMFWPWLNFPHNQKS